MNSPTSILVKGGSTRVRVDGAAPAADRAAAWSRAKSGRLAPQHRRLDGYRTIALDIHAWFRIL
jgi:hypothetical protein